MQRSKQQALMFLLGAVLVGGVIGASAIKVMDKKPPRQSARVQMYDDIGIDSARRVTMDSVLDETNCRLGEVIKLWRPRTDSIRDAGFATIRELMTAEQREAFDARALRMKAHNDSVEKARDAEWAKNHPDRPRRCAASGPRGGPGAQPDRGGPRPFL
jgi:hypothetical protein